MYKVFTDKSVVTIKEISGFSKDNDYLNDAQQVVNQLEKGVVDISIETSEAQKVFNKVFEDHQLIEAAGGLVSNEEDEFLIIHRLGKWDLPKGKIEQGESVETAALREVEEECGITGLKIQKRLIDTYHTYNLKGKVILKKTYWYWMKTVKDQNLVPQTEEDITEVKWLPWEERAAIYGNTYENIKEVIASAENFI